MNSVISGSVSVRCLPPFAHIYFNVLVSHNLDTRVVQLIFKFGLIRKGFIWVHVVAAEVAQRHQVT